MIEGFSDASRVGDFLDDGISHVDSAGHGPKFILYWKGTEDKERKAWFSKYENMKKNIHDYYVFGFYSHGIYGTRDLHCPGSLVKYRKITGHNAYNMLIYTPSLELDYEVIINKYKDICKNIYI